MNPSRPSYTSTSDPMGAIFYSSRTDVWWIFCAQMFLFWGRPSFVGETPTLSRSAVQSFYDPSFDVLCAGANCKPGTLLKYVFCTIMICMCCGNPVETGILCILQSPSCSVFPLTLTQTPTWIAGYKRWPTKGIHAMGINKLYISQSMDEY